MTRIRNFRGIAAVLLAAAIGGASPARAADAPASPGAPADIGPQDLPPDEPHPAEVVYDLKYAITHVNELEVGATSLTGDKFLSTYGVSIDDRYHLSESFAVGIGLSFFTSSISSEATTLSAESAAPVVYNPNWLARATLLYEPIYGKFLLGSAIAHFKLGVEAGLHLAHEELANASASGQFNSSGNLIENSRLAPGPLVGLRFETYLGPRVSLIGSADFMVHGTLSGDDSGSLRRLWAYTVGMGYRF